MNLEELIFLLLNGKSDVFEFIKDVYAQTKDIPDTDTNNLIISGIDNKYAKYVSKITGIPPSGGGGSMSFTMTPSQIRIFNNMVRNIASLVNVPPSNSRRDTVFLRSRIKELEQKLQQLEQDNAFLQEQLRQAQQNTPTAPQQPDNLLQQKLQQLEQDNAYLQQQLQQAQQNTPTAPQQQLQQLQTDNASLQQQLQQLQTDNASLQQQLQKLQTDNASLQQQLLEAQQNTTPIVPQQQLIQLQTDNASLQQQLQKLQTDNASLQQQLQQGPQIAPAPGPVGPVAPAQISSTDTSETGTSMEIEQQPVTTQTQTESTNNETIEELNKKIEELTKERDNNKKGYERLGKELEDMKNNEADANRLTNPDYTQIYMFYNRKKNPNDKGKLKMHVYNKDNTSKSFYESFNDTINNAIEDVDDQLLFMNNYLSNNKKEESIVPTVKYIKNEIKSDGDDVKFSKYPMSEAELQKSVK